MLGLQEVRLTGVNMFKVVVAGGRDFDDYGMLIDKLNHLLQNKSEIVIVSGAAKGADKLGENYAKARGLKVESFPADWETHGKAAGPFWDGESKGSKNMIDTMKKLNKPVKVVRY